MLTGYAAVRRLRRLVGGRAVKRGAASASVMGRFEPQMPARTETLAVLLALPGRCRARSAIAEKRHPRYGRFREPGAWRSGGCDVERALPVEAPASALRVHPVRRSGTVCPASRQRPQRRWPGICPEGLCRRDTRPRRGLRSSDGDFALTPPLPFRRSSICRRPRAGMTRSASRAIPSCTIRIGWLIKRRPGRPANHVVRRYTGFHYRAGSRSKARQVRQRSCRAIVASVRFFGRADRPARRLTNDGRVRPVRKRLPPFSLLLAP